MAVIGSLGTVIFQVSNDSLFSGKGMGAVGSLLNMATNQKGIIYRTPKNYQRKSSARWAVHYIIGQKPVSEFIGAGLESFSFGLTLDAELGTNPNKELEKLRQMRDTGEKVFLILGNKPVLKNGARVYITDISENVIRTNKNGKITAIDVSVSLQEYTLRQEEMFISGNSTNKSG